MKPKLTWDEQALLLVSRGLFVEYEAACVSFLLCVESLLPFGGAGLVLNGTITKYMAK